MFEFSVGEDMNKKNDVIREVAAHLCLTLIVKNSKLVSSKVGW